MKGRALLKPGASFGCWSVSDLPAKGHDEPAWFEPDDRGRRIYRIVASCCGRKMKREQGALMRTKSAMCVKCRRKQAGNAMRRRAAHTIAAKKRASDAKAGT